MTLTVNFSAELMDALRAFAGRTGQDLDHTVARLLQEQLHQQLAPEAGGSRCSPAETALLREIQQGLPEATWRRYRELAARREAETLTDAEQPELVALADLVEGWSVRRLELAQQLAVLRGVSWQTVVEDLSLMADSTAARTRVPIPPCGG